MKGETERSLFKIDYSLGIILPKEWIKKKGLKKGDKVRLIYADKLLISMSETEEEINKEIEQYERDLREGEE